MFEDCDKLDKQVCCFPQGICLYNLQKTADFSLGLYH